MMKRFLPLVLLCACAVPTGQVVVIDDIADEIVVVGSDQSDRPKVHTDDTGTEPGQKSSFYPKDRHNKKKLRITEQGIRARVIQSVIQRNRVLLTLDAGSDHGVYRGMKGVLDNGRFFTVVTVDFRYSSAVLVGLNVRIGAGTEATLLW